MILNPKMASMLAGLASQAANEPPAPLPEAVPSIKPKVKSLIESASFLVEYTNESAKSAEHLPVPEPGQYHSAETTGRASGVSEEINTESLLMFLKQAAEKNASDVHLIPGNPVAFRINDVLKALSDKILLHEEIERMIFPLLSEKQKIDLALHQDLDISWQPLASVRVRMNVHYEKRGMAVAMRLLADRILTFKDLMLPEFLKDLILYPHGLILVTGPTGSGKSTTLAALIDLINNQQSRHIITIEDPIEYHHKSKNSLVEQRELNTSTPSFASALKHALRQDPDVILVGEMRDLETISLAITAAETGHLVFSTLHTNDAPQTIDRMVDVFPPHQQNQVRHQLSLSLATVVCQRLVRREDREGRVPVLEVLRVDTAVRNMIRKGSTHEIYGAMETARANGNLLWDDSLFGYVQQDILTRSTANGLARFPELFKQKFGEQTSKR